MGKVTPHKQSKWLLEVNGVDVATFQTINIPEKTIETAEHVEGDLKIKTPSLVSVSDMTVGKLINMLEVDTYFNDWFNQVKNTKAGTGGLPSDYERTIRVRLLDDQNNTTRLYEMTGCYPISLGSIDLDKTSSDNIIEEMTINVFDYEQVQ